MIKIRTKTKIFFDFATYITLIIEDFLNISRPLAKILILDFKPQMNTDEHRLNQIHLLGFNKLMQEV